MNEIFHNFKFEELISEWEKYVFIEKNIFEPMGISAHKAKFLVLGNALNILFRLFDVSTQTDKM